MREEFRFKAEPYAHQLRDFERFRNKEAYALFWEMGLGKSKTTIDIAAHKFLATDCDRFVIIAPNTVHAQWINEQLPAHCPLPFNGFVYETNSSNKYMESLIRFLGRCEEPNTMHWLAIHIESFQYDKVEKTLERFLLGRSPFWIVDEATRIKNPEAVSVRRLCSLRRKFGGHAAILTGTSLAKSPVDTWQMLEFIHQGYMGCSYTAFNRRHAILTKHEVEITRKGRTFKHKVDVALTEKKYFMLKRNLQKLREQGEVSVDDYVNLAQKHGLSLEDVRLVEEMSQYTKFKNIDQLKIQLAPISSALKKEHCLDLPEKQYQEVVFELSPEQKKILDDMKKYAVAAYGGKELTISHKAALQIRALQVCGGFFPHVKDLGNLDAPLYGTARMEGKNAKLDYLRGDLVELGDTAFIVWAVFVPELDMLANELNKLAPVGLLSGSTPPSQRRAVVEAFKRGELQGLVANPQVAGYGLNFQHAPVQYWYSRNYRTEARLQAEDRSHRIGTKVSPLYKDLIYNAEFERAVLKNNKEGKEMNDYFNTATVENLFTI